MKNIYCIDVPSAPGKPAGETIDKNTIKITWSAPSSDGGSPVSGYCIERMVGQNGTWEQIKDNQVSFDIELYALCYSICVCYQK